MARAPSSNKDNESKTIQSTNNASDVYADANATNNNNAPNADANAHATNNASNADDNAHATMGRAPSFNKDNLSNTIDDAVPVDDNANIPGAATNDATAKIPDVVPNDTNSNISSNGANASSADAVPDDDSVNIPDAAPNDAAAKIPDVANSNIVDAAPNEATAKIPDAVSNDTCFNDTNAYIPDAVCNHANANIPDAVSNDVNANIPDAVPNHASADIPDAVSNDASNPTPSRGQASVWPTPMCAHGSARPRYGQPPRPNEHIDADKDELVDGNEEGSDVNASVHGGTKNGVAYEVVNYLGADEVDDREVGSDLSEHVYERYINE
jgi:hypothetical protein